MADWVAIGGVATAAVALPTAAAALWTARQQREAAKAATRPLLLPVPVGRLRGVEVVTYQPRVYSRRFEDRSLIEVKQAPAGSVVHPSWYVSVPYRNEGAGLAVVSSVGIWHAGAVREADRAAVRGGSYPDGAVLSAVTPVGETGRANFTVRDEDLWVTAGERNGFFVDIAYTDAAGGQPSRSRFYLAEDDDVWRVVSIALYRIPRGFTRVGTSPYIKTDVQAYG